MLKSYNQQHAPIDPAQIQAIVNDHATTDSDTFAKAVALQLGVKLSQHKFIVTVTQIAAKDVDANIRIDSAVATVCGDRDGYVTFAVGSQPQHLVTVYWISVN